MVTIEEQKTAIDKIKQIQERYDTEDIIEMVHKYLTKDNGIQHQQRIDQGRTGKFYPSSIGRCKRAVAYQMMGYPTKPIPGQNLLIMANGTGFHERMEDIFEKMGIMIAPELSLKDEALRISGRSDAIIWNYLLEDGEEPADELTLYDAKDRSKVVYQGPANHILICEFKSIKSKNYAKLPKSKPLKKHEMQLQLYFYLTGIKKGMVYYENKDTQESISFLVEYNDAMIQEVKNDIEFILHCVDNEILPEKEGNALDVMCRYCDFRNNCHPPLSDEEWFELYYEDAREDAS